MTFGKKPGTMLIKVNNTLYVDPQKIQAIEWHNARGWALMTNAWHYINANELEALLKFMGKEVLPMRAL